MSGPTVNAVFDGRVQGVVVQAKKSTGKPSSATPALASNAVRDSAVAWNWATMVVSFTSR